jgi:hypothetical protein
MGEDKETLTFDQDPRKVFINFLIYQLNYTVSGIYSYTARLQRRSIRPLMGLIASLDERSKQALKDKYEELVRFDRTGNWTLGGLQEIYDNVLSYLHRTYLSEISYVKPLNPKPQHISEVQR